METDRLTDLTEAYGSLIKKRKHYIEAVALMQWDLQTNAPRGAVQGRSEAIGTISTEAFMLLTSDELDGLLTELLKIENYESLSPVLQVAVKEDKRELERYRKIPTDKYRAYKTLTAKAQAVWQEAKMNNDFQLFQPYLEEIVQYQRDVLELFGYKGDKYNVLLDQYEPGMTTEILDEIFQYIKDKTIPLVKKIQLTGNRLNEEMLLKPYGVEKQKELSRRVLQDMGYDFNRGRMDVSAHPFTIKLNSGDVRLTTHFSEHYFKNALYASIHEGGHALYEQNISHELKDTSLFGGASMGIHESQSRYWENMIGRSLEFWKYFYTPTAELFKENLMGTTAETMYKAINKIQPSLIRILADELTYNLHIILRYEIEKDLINGMIEVADLPRVWNEKMEDYLGIRPEKDGEGVLQDVHWSSGMFGYFPSYSLGNVYAAQFAKKMKETIANYEDIIEKGNFKPILNWLRENIHSHGKLYKPAELVQRVTGEAINPKYFIEYVENKYQKIYQLD